jgi:two-component system CheB/CheR fusion protein
MERSNGKRDQVYAHVHLPRVERRVKNKTKRDARVSSNNIFPVAGIGCSAGGVEALQFFFQNMPPDSGIAFIVVSHLARDYHSLLPEIVARHARMPVTTALDGETIEPNTVYICPPNHILRVEKRTLQLTPRLSDQQHKPIDVFLGSLAEDFAEASIGILLSGSGSDGALGMKAIKGCGGLTVAQGGNGKGPLHSQMPDAAIASGMVDIVARVEQIPSRLADYAHSFRLLESKADRDVERRTDDDAAERYQLIYALLLSQVGHDFSGYKEKSFTRRVRRRMQVVGVTRLEEYIARLKKDPDEVNLLFRDLLIGVTNFFRDPEAFEALAQLVIPRLFEGKAPADSVRVWCPACATGEEVYSLAILLREHMDGIRTPPKVQIFATDIDEQAIAIGRTGYYPRQMLEGVSPGRLKRFFASDDVSYTVRKELRDLCIFSAHSVMRDPPFSRVDLISCRNLLIYLDGAFQSRVIPVFHFALREGGFLFLGTSENVTQHADLFAPVDKKHRIFQRRDHVVSPVRFPFVPQARSLPATRELRQDQATAAANLRRSVENRVVERFAPAHVVVNAQGDILHFSPRTGKYLEPATGSPNRQLLAMARKGLRLYLRSALREAVQTRAPVTREHVEVELDERKQLVDLTIEPFGSHEDPLFLVLFSDVGRAFSPAASEPASRLEARPEHSRELEHEVRELREHLQSTIEEYDSSVEELKSSNEELQSINEELQSTNEELETSKEELQAVNEELHTVNAELNSKVDELDRAHNDLRNLFDSTQIATIFLDRDFRIRSFTPPATELFNLISSDCGRPLTDIVSKFKSHELRRDVETVLERGEPIERSVRRSDGRADYLMRILPYRAHDHMVEGVIVTFVEITRILEAEAQQRAMVEELNHRVRNMLTVVNAIARQTLAQTQSPQEFAAAFEGRIQAMAASHSLLSRENWREVFLRDLITEQLKPHQLGPGERIEVNGPDVHLTPNAAVALGLVVHEFTTNAVKHGSLSQANGRVSIVWSIQDEPTGLVLQWTEAGGPAAKKPARKGFGTTLIERELKQIGGNAKLGYKDTGFEATLSIPFDPKLMSMGPGAKPS